MNEEKNETEFYDNDFLSIFLENAKEKDKIPFNIHLQMERLVNIALSDGKITAKEKEIIFRKAKTLGVDEDETEMILDALVSLRQQKNQNVDLSEKEIENIFQEKRKESYVGEVKKCPNCGAEVTSFQVKCFSCGYEFRGIKAGEAVSKFYEESKFISEKDYPRFIQNFPVPNDIGTLLEFLIFSISNLSESGYSSGEGINYSSTRGIISGALSSSFTTVAKQALGYKITKAWKIKCSNVIEKINIAIIKNPEYTPAFENLKKKHKAALRKAFFRSQTFKTILGLLMMFALYVYLHFITKL